MHRQSSVTHFFFLKSCFPSLFLIIFFRLSPYCFAMSTGIFINYFKRLLRRHVVGGNWNIVLCPDVLTQLAPFYVDLETEQVNCRNDATTEEGRFPKVCL